MAGDPVTPLPHHRVAVIDVGSNSGRVVVLGVGPQDHLEVLADSRAPLRLARDIQRGAEFRAVTIERTAQVISDFVAVARSAGAGHVLAVATAAVRESPNAHVLLERIRTEAGLGVRTITGEEEARYAFMGAVHGLAVHSGLVFDIGGGSLEVTRFEERRPVESWSLPLGALLLSDRFLEHDPPTEGEIDALRDTVHRSLDDIGLGPLGRAETLVGTGGTVRNVARIDREARTYPLPRLHGYVLTSRKAFDVVGRLSRRASGRRRSVPGLNSDRADSIVGGAMVVQTLMDIVASDVIVSGQGLREGLALETMSGVTFSIEQTRRESIRALASRFSAWDEPRASRRSSIGLTLLVALEPDSGPATRERLETASTLLDVGRSVDYYQRHQHAADIVTEADLVGFSHRELAFLAAVIRTAGDDTTRWQMYRPLLEAKDRVALAREGLLLTLADEIEQRASPPQAGSISCQVRGKDVVLTAPIRDPWLQESLQRRFSKAFGKRLRFG